METNRFTSRMGRIMGAFITRNGEKIFVDIIVGVTVAVATLLLAMLVGDLAR